MRVAIYKTKSISQAFLFSTPDINADSDVEEANFEDNLIDLDDIDDDFLDKENL